MKYSVCASKKEDKDFEAQNGMFVALVMIGLTVELNNYHTLTVNERYIYLKSTYQNNRESITMCNKGVQFICDLVKSDEIYIRKRKCLNYANKNMGKRFYTDTSIIPFADKLLSCIDKDSAIQRLLEEELQKECQQYTINSGNPTLRDCVMHIFGFQYQGLKKIVRNRLFPESKKSKALRDCLKDMSTVLEHYNYPNPSQP